MISMTGYGRAEARAGDLAIALEIKTVNHRYFEAAIRLPGGLNELEPVILDNLRKVIRRGRVEVYLHLLTPVAGTREPVVDAGLAAKYAEALRQAGQRLKMPGEIDFSMLVRLPDVIRVEERPVQVQAIGRLADKAMRQALNKVLVMRRAEGKKLATDIRRRLAAIRSLARTIAADYGKHLREQEARLKEQIRQWVGEESADWKRAVQDACLRQVRADVTEELVRLDSHFGQFSQFLQSPEPAGRKMDFLIQEMNREINTIGSKAGMAAHRVVTFKEELEKIREQIQNLE